MSKTLIIMVFLVIRTACNAQSATNSSAADTIKRSAPGQLVSLVLHKTVGRFDQSHGIGAGLEYALASGRFGSGAKPLHKIGWIAKGGFDFFAGKKDPVEGNSFRYSNYLYAHVLGGLICNPLPFAHAFVVAGPGIGLYSGAASVGFNAAFAANVFIDQRISVGPTLTFRKHKEAEGLWTAGFRIGLALPN